MNKPKKQGDRIMLHRKICVIVGGAKGKGRRLAEEYAGQKYRIAFMDIDKKSGDSLKEKIEGEYGGRVFFFNGNVNSEEDRELFAGAVSAQYGKIDCLYYRSDIEDKREESEKEIEELLKGSLRKKGILKDFA